MLGLLIKDIELTLLNKKLFLFLGVIGVLMIGIKGETATSFVIAFFSIMCGMLVLSTITYDEFDRSIAYLFTLPTTRFIYTVEKYVFGLSSLLFGWTISSILSLVYLLVNGSEFSMKEYWLSSICVFIIIALVIIIMIPIQIKFGGDNGRMVLFGISAMVMLIGLGGAKLCTWLNIDIETIAVNSLTNIMDINKVVLGGIITVLFIVITLISSKISYSIIKKKEF